MRGMRWGMGRGGTTAAMLAAGLVAWCLAGTDEAEPRRAADGSGAGKEIQAGVPDIPPWPRCWEYAFTKPDAVQKGTTLKVAVRVTPLLFDAGPVEIRAAVTRGGLEIVGEPAVWKGSLKKGEAHALEFTVRATADGYNGQYGVFVTAPEFYRRIREYIATCREEPYATTRDKQSVMERIAIWEQETPRYQDWAGGSIQVKAGVQ